MNKSSKVKDDSKSKENPAKNVKTNNIPIKVEYSEDKSNKK